MEKVGGTTPGSGGVGIPPPQSRSTVHWGLGLRMKATPSVLRAGGPGRPAPNPGRRRLGGGDRARDQRGWGGGWGWRGLRGSQLSAFRCARKTGPSSAPQEGPARTPGPQNSPPWGLRSPRKPGRRRGGGDTQGAQAGLQGGGPRQAGPLAAAAAPHRVPRAATGPRRGPPCGRHGRDPPPSPHLHARPGRAGRGPAAHLHAWRRRAEAQPPANPRAPRG